ncbi:MAG: hypothetical protein KF816_02115 [Melioribacteraceae bacterium]|nr:hypothetical protein [Melioribacteraceae bacterium]
MRELVVYCVKIASICLRSHHLSDCTRFSNQGLTLEDIAFDAVSPLFIKRNCESELPLKRALLNWDKPIDSEQEAYFFLSQLIGSRVEQEISKKLKEADPFFGKILRSINYTIEKRGYSKTPYFGVIHVVENSSVIVNQLPPEPEFIESLQNELFRLSNDQIVSSLFEFIKNETDYFPAIPLNALVKRIKEFHAHYFDSLHSSNEIKIDEKMDVEHITNTSLEQTITRLNDFYFYKGKINAEEAIVYESVLKNYADDLKDGGVSRGLYEYFNTHMSDLTREDFYKKYYQNLDYLIRLLKKGISEKLENSK